MTARIGSEVRGLPLLPLGCLLLLHHLLTLGGLLGLLLLAARRLLLLLHLQALLLTGFLRLLALEQHLLLLGLHLLPLLRCLLLLASCRLLLLFRLQALLLASLLRLLTLQHHLLALLLALSSLLLFTRLLRLRSLLHLRWAGLPLLSPDRSLLFQLQALLSVGLLRLQSVLPPPDGIVTVGAPLATLPTRSVAICVSHLRSGTIRTRGCLAIPAARQRVAGPFGDRLIEGGPQGRSAGPAFGAGRVPAVDPLLSEGGAIRWDTHLSGRLGICRAGRIARPDTIGRPSGSSIRFRCPAGIGHDVALGGGPRVGGAFRAGKCMRIGSVPPIRSHGR